MKRTSVLAFLLVLGLMWPSQSQADVIVMFDSGTTNTTTSLTGFGTTGGDMDGMSLTAWFSDGSSETVAWTDIVDGTSGHAVGTDWSVTETGDTFGGDWTVVNSRSAALDRLLIDGGPGDTIFDTYFDDLFGTDGSARGLDFAVVSGLGSLDIVATYRDQIALTGFSAVGDLFRKLDINFAGNGTGLAGTLSFEADTDNSLLAGDIVPEPVPTPSTLIGLLGIGAIGIVAQGWRRRKR